MRRRSAPCAVTYCENESSSRAFSACSSQSKSNTRQDEPLLRSSEEIRCSKDQSSAAQPNGPMHGASLTPIAISVPSAASMLTDVTPLA